MLEIKHKFEKELKTTIFYVMSKNYLQ